MRIPVASWKHLDWRGPRSGVKFRVVANETFLARDTGDVGVNVEASPKEFREVVCTIATETIDGYSTTTLTVPAMWLFSTTDAIVGRNARYSAQFVTNSGGIIDALDLLQDFQVPPSLLDISNPTTWQEIIRFNKPAAPVPIDRETFSREQILELIGRASGSGKANVGASAVGGRISFWENDGVTIGGASGAFWSESANRFSLGVQTGFKLGTFGTDPTVGVNGRLWYNTTDNRAMIEENGAQFPLRTVFTFDNELSSNNHTNITNVIIDEASGLSLTGSAGDTVTISNNKTATIEVRDIDSNPDYLTIHTVEFNLADGFTLSNPSAGVARIGLSASASGFVDGSGTAFKVPLWTDSNSLQDSIATQDVNSKGWTLNGGLRIVQPGPLVDGSWNGLKVTSNTDATVPNTEWANRDGVTKLGVTGDVNLYFVEQTDVVIAAGSGQAKLWFNGRAGDDNRQLLLSKSTNAGLPVITHHNNTASPRNIPMYHATANFELTDSILSQSSDGEYLNVGGYLNLGDLVSDPASPPEGAIWYNVTSRTYKGYANGVVQTFSVGGSATWGGITGTLSSQTDLAAALAAKVASTRSVSGALSITGGGDLSADRTFSLVNDTATPGNSKYYGTDGSGTRGWFSLPTSGLADPGGAGVVVRTTAGVTVARTLTGQANKILIANGDGQSGAPTFTIGTDIVTLTDAQALTNKSLGASTSVTAAISFTAGVRQTFAPNATTPGFNPGSVAGDPSTPSNGDMWYDSTNNLLRARINGATVSLGAGGGSLSGSGTTNRVAVWSSSSALAASGQIREANSKIGFGLTSDPTTAGVANNSAFAAIGDFPTSGGSTINYGNWNSLSVAVPLAIHGFGTNGGSSMATAQPILLLGLNGVATQSFASTAVFAMNRYSNVSTPAQTALELQLNDQSAEYPTAVMRWQGNGRAGMNNGATNSASNVARARFHINGQMTNVGSNFLSSDSYNSQGLTPLLAVWDATAATNTVMAAPIVMVRQGVNAGQEGSRVEFAMGRYESVSNAPRTRFDIRLAHATNESRGVRVASFYSYGGLGVGLSDASNDAASNNNQGAVLEIQSKPTTDDSGSDFSSYNGTGRRVPLGIVVTQSNGGTSPTAGEPFLIATRQGVSGQSFGNHIAFLIRRAVNSGNDAYTGWQIRLRDTGTSDNLTSGGTVTPQFEFLSRGQFGINTLGSSVVGALHITAPTTSMEGVYIDLPNGSSQNFLHLRLNSVDRYTFGSSGTFTIKGTPIIQAASPTQTTSTQAGSNMTINGSNATPGSSSAGAAKGGDVAMFGGNADRLTSGNADGGAVTLGGGFGIGTGVNGRVKIINSAVEVQLIDVVPTSSPADASTMYSADSAAGNNEMFIRNENGKVTRLTGTFARVGTQFDKTSDTTLANVTNLSLTVEAGKTYTFEAMLFTTSNSGGGVQAAIGGTCTATSIIYSGTTTDSGVNTKGRTTTKGNSVGGVTAVTAADIYITGTIVVNAAGTLTVQFAQNASNGTASSVLVGSWFRLVEN